MIQSLLALAAATVRIGARASSSTSAPDFGTELQQLASEFSSDATQLLTTIDGTVIGITQVAYITVLLLGVFLYFTHLSRRLGRELIMGGVVLAVLSEFVFPAITKL